MSKQESWPVIRTPQDLVRAALNALFPREKMQTPKRQTFFTYVDGPMYYLGQQIVKLMQDSGYPAKIVECYRSPERQKKLKHQGRSKAGPWHSPHQYFEAVDIVHPSKGWDVSSDYWEKLATCVRIVAQKYGVELNHGHHWAWRDSAHIELGNWRVVRQRFKPVLDTATIRKSDGQPVRSNGEPLMLNQSELWERFVEVLPEVAKEYSRR